MKAEKFDQIVNARTNELTDEKIETFRKEVYASCRRLFGQSESYSRMWNQSKWDKDYRSSLSVLASEDNRAGWPPFIMERIKSIVVEDLMRTFDEFTKASLAASRAAEPKNKMEEVSEEDGTTTSGS